jgi:multiple sugar transport system substrate-binding protein
MLKALSSNESNIDLISIDQIWLGEFAQRGLLADLSDRAEKWRRLSDWYEANLDGNLYDGKIYGIWAWTDVRSIWYWKDLLQEAGVQPESLKTWNSYIMSAKKLGEVLRPQGIEGTELICGNNSANVWYPFLWMVGGEIVKFKEGHPTKGNYFFPDYNGTEGIKALQFLKDQADVGIKPKTTDFGKDFVNRKVALMLAGSWLPADFPRTGNDTSQKKRKP